MPRHHTVTVLLVILVTGFASVAHAQSDPYEWQRLEWERQERERMIRDANFARQQQQQLENSQKQIELMGQYNAARMKAAELSAQEAREKKAQQARRVPALWSSGLSQETDAALRRVLQKGLPITGLTFTPNGGHVVTFGRNGYDARKAPSALLEALDEANQAGEEIRSVAVDDSGGWVFLRNGNGYSCAGVTEALVADLRSNNEKGARLSHVALTPDGGHMLIIGRNGWDSRGAPRRLLEVMSQANDQNERLDGVAFARGWLLLHDGSLANWSNIPADLEKALREIARTRATVQAVALGSDGRWAVVGEVSDPRDPAAVRVVASR